MKKTSKKAKMAMEVGAGMITAAALAVAGAYVLSDKKRMAKAKTWAAKARKEAAKNVKIAKRMSEREYVRIVDEATKRYGALHNVGGAELVKAAKDIKAEWKKIQSEAKKLGKRKVAPKRKKAAQKGTKARSRR
jgi:hypothetical protein